MTSFALVWLAVAGNAAGDATCQTVTSRHDMLSSCVLIAVLDWQTTARSCQTRHKSNRFSRHYQTTSDWKRVSCADFAFSLETATV